jgi:hypothetical protein
VCVVFGVRGAEAMHNALGNGPHRALPPLPGDRLTKRFGDCGEQEAVEFGFAHLRRPQMKLLPKKRDGIRSVAKKRNTTACETR